MAADAWMLTDSVAASLRVLDDSFAQAASRLGAAVPCRRGCSACCVAVFDIHPADALLLGRWLDGLGEQARMAVLERCDEILGAMRQMVTVLSGQGATDDIGDADLAGWTPEDGLSSLTDKSITRLAEAISMPCPVLGPEGECGAYALRPAICRIQGLPWEDLASGWIVPDLCRLDERQAATTPLPLDFSPLDAARWDVRDGLADDLGHALPRGRTFVAEALRRWSRQVDDGRAGGGEAVAR